MQVLMRAKFRLSCITITGAELTRTVSSAAWMPSSEIG